MPRPESGLDWHMCAVHGGGVGGEGVVPPTTCACLPHLEIHLTECTFNQFKKVKPLLDRQLIVNIAN